MGASARDVINRIKKFIDSTDLSTAGKLNPAQQNKFIDYMFLETVMGPYIQTRRFTNEQSYIEVLNLSTGRAALPATEGADSGLRHGISTTRLTLTPKEFIVPADISDTFKEINLEGTGVKDRIIKMFATCLMNDLEVAGFHAKTEGVAELESFFDSKNGSATEYVVDGFLKLFTGWLAYLKANANVVDCANAQISAAVFSSLINALPGKYLTKEKKNFKFYVAPELEQLYRQVFGTRATAEADIVLTTDKKIMAFGYEIVPCPLLAFTPKIVEHVELANTETDTLAFKPISNATVHTSTLPNYGGTPETPYTITSDYTVNLANGTITRVGGAIGNPETVKVCYQAGPQVIFTHVNNLIMAIGRDIRIETDRNIQKRADEFVISGKSDYLVQNAEAAVLGINVART